jgi:Carbamoylphosphate synthase large subunit (split gene in MJ)
VGFTLDELKNEITGGKTPASFEPPSTTWSPRSHVLRSRSSPCDNRLTTQMKSVGEVMAIGRTFQESFQKALRGLEVGVDGMNEKTQDREILEKELGEPGPDRIWYVGDAFAAGWSLDEVHAITKIDKWFLVQIEEIVKIELDLDKHYEAHGDKACPCWMPPRCARSSKRASRTAVWPSCCTPPTRRCAKRARR